MSNPTAGAASKPIQKDNVEQIHHKIDHSVDVKLRKLTDEVLPNAPYILSGGPGFCMNEEYVKKNYPQNAINFRKFSLFTADEAELQYMTFLKDRPGDDQIGVFHSQGGWDDGKGRIAAKVESHSRTSSDGTPKQGQPPKKKISLAEYKNKDRSKAVAPAPKPAIHAPEEPVKSENKTLANTAVVKDVSKSQQAEQYGQKRSADAMTGTKDPQSFVHPPSLPPAKKVRVTMETNTAAPESHQKTIPHKPQSEPAPKQNKVSGDKEPSGEVKVVKDTMAAASGKIQVAPSNAPPEKLQKSLLPPMLSPLSSEVEDMIAKMTPAASNGRPGTANSKTSLISPSPTPSKPDRPSTPAVGKVVKANSAGKAAASTKTTKSTTPTKRPQEHKRPTPDPVREAKEAVLKVSTTPKDAQQAPPNGTKAVSTPTPKTTPPNAPKRMRLRISLKIKKKSNKKKLRDYLNLKSTPGRNSLFPGRAIEQEQRQADTTSYVKPSNKDRNNQELKKGDSKVVRPEGPKVSNKRSRAHVDEDKSESSAKRKAPARFPQAHNANTPKPSQTSSPALNYLGSAQKPPTSTPNVQASGTSMLRGGSAQGSVHTPCQPSVTGTPTAPETGRHRSSYTSPNKPKSDDMRPEAHQYHTTARALKHETDVFLNHKAATSEEEVKKGLVLGTETVLCFMMAFVLGDTTKRYSDRDAWKSIIPFLTSVQRTAQSKEAVSLPESADIHGLLCQLEAVIRDQVAYVDMQLLDRNPLEHDFGESVSDPTMTKEQSKAAAYHQYYSTYHAGVQKAHSAWRTGWVSLDIAKIRSRYPATWAQRDEQRAAYGKGRDAIKKGEFTRKYNLPMGVMTSGLEAINFGMNFLTEWSEAMGVDWHPKLIL